MSSGGGPTGDKPTVTFALPTNPNMVSYELNIRVPDSVEAFWSMWSNDSSPIEKAQELCAAIDKGREVEG